MSSELAWEDLDPELTWGDLDPELMWQSWLNNPDGPNIVLNGTIHRSRQKSLRIRETIDDHSDGNVQLIDGDPRRGMPVSVLGRDGVTVFSGWVDDVRTRVLGGKLIHELSMSDHWWLTEKRVVGAVWEDDTAGGIVRNIVDTVLSEEGITYTPESVDDGPRVLRWGAAYRQCSEVISELADQANFVCYVDIDRVLHFHARDRFNSPWNLTGADVLDDGLRRRRGNDQYRNSQWMVGGKDTTQPITEQFAGDGERRTFNVGFPVRREPTIALNGQPQTVGVRGLNEDSDKDWLFAHQSTELTQNDENPKLTASDLLEVVYEGVFEFVARQTDAAAIDARTNIEGGGTSGVVEKVTKREFASRAEAFQIGSRRLDKYARPSSLVEAKTVRDGLKAGQVADVSLPSLSVDGEMLVTSVVLDDLGAGHLVYKVTLVDGPHEESWRKLFRALAMPDTDQLLENISEDDTVSLLKTFDKDWTFGENPNMLRRLTAGDGVKADGTYTATFANDHRISHLEWTALDGVTVMGRNQLIDRQGLDTHEVTSTGYLSPAQGSDGGVGQLRWYGGHRATLSPGSGVLVATVVVNEEKTSAESWQVDRTDRTNASWDDDRAAALGS